MASTNVKIFNRELSWLAFNLRVLEQACDEKVPLLERVKFLGITVSNLDEFFMVRVGSLLTLARQRSIKPDPSGYTPHQQLDMIRERVRDMIGRQYGCYADLLEAVSQGRVQQVGVAFR